MYNINLSAVSAICSSYTYYIDMVWMEITAGKMLCFTCFDVAYRYYKYHFTKNVSLTVLNAVNCLYNKI